MLEPAEGGVRGGAGRAGGRGVLAGGQPGHRPRLRVDLHQGRREARHAAVANKVRTSRQGNIVSGRGDPRVKGGNT